ncbi:MAG: hypothetical protein IJI58_02670 [Bacilli bacterium]|nr:hypothetical protein [Bacilli bacterium]
MKKNKKRNVIIVLIVLLLAISIGYAVLQSTLNIQGTAGIDSVSWDIHWNNVEITPGSVSTSTANKATIDSSLTTVNYNITLEKPGDYYEFTVDAVNGGTLDAMIASITSKMNGETITTLPAYLIYTVTYSDGTALAENQKLGAGQSKKYKVRIEFKKNIENSQLPNGAQNLNLSFTVAYKQADGNAIEPPTAENYVYRSNTDVVEVGDGTAALGVTYSSYSAMNSATNKTVFLRHKITNNQVESTEVGFIYENNEYYLTGGINEAAEENRPIFSANNVVITGLGGSCNTSRCTLSKNGFVAYATLQGQAYAYNDEWRCDVAVDGSSYCQPR